MNDDKPIYEREEDIIEQDPDEEPIYDRKLLTQPYDLVIESLIEQINNKTLYLRPISERPSFQRRYVWPDLLASRLIESILLNVPIPPCYLSQNEEFELDVIDGQQRIYSIYRFLKNQFRLSGLEILKEINKKFFFELDRKVQRKIATHTLRCVVITNDSNPKIKFDVFERLNTNTVPLNAQELRNCIYRGSLIDLLGKLSEYEPWHNILRTKKPDKRMRDEELILRFYAFQIKGIESYYTPQKHWLNDMAKEGRRFSNQRIEELSDLWKSTIDKCLLIFSPHDCFRRLPVTKSKVINRALMDLTMCSLANVSQQKVRDISKDFYNRYLKLMNNQDFIDIISKSVDHKSRTLGRFIIWHDEMCNGLC